LQKFLFIGAVVILVAALANIFLQLPALMLTISVLAIVIFSAFMLVDLQRVVNGGETNYVSATLAIYLDVYNVFSNLLMLLGIFGGNRE
jgi:modulator of FtsH protease